MKKLIKISSILILSSQCYYPSSTIAQTFQNFDFESANLPSIPAGQYGGEVSASAALPSWTVYLGTDQQSQVLQNNYDLGSATVDILGPHWNASGTGFQ